MTPTQAPTQEVVQPTQTPVVIEGDKQARYEFVMKVMSDLQTAGIERVGLLVELNQR